MSMQDMVTIATTKATRMATRMTTVIMKVTTMDTLTESYSHHIFPLSANAVCDELHKGSPPYSTSPALYFQCSFKIKGIVNFPLLMSCYWDIKKIL